MNAKEMEKLEPQAQLLGKPGAPGEAGLTETQRYSTMLNPCWALSGLTVGPDAGCLSQLWLP